MEILLELFKYILLGFIQGVTEVLPISSSGHVAFVKQFLSLDVDTNVLFLIILNLGSMVAVVYFLRKDVKELIVDSYRYVFKKVRTKEVNKNYQYIKDIIVAIIPIAFFGFLLSGAVSSLYDNYTFIAVGIGALATGTILYFVRNSTNANVNLNLTYKDSVFIGIVQTFALFPGLSRLGITTAAGLKRKISMDSILKFTFLMYIPISIGSIIQQCFSSENGALFSNLGVESAIEYLYYLIGFGVSLVTTYFALRLVFIWFRRGKLGFFYVYNFVFGFIALLIGLATFR
jgi:undecaprenyl-diphosphatase